MQTPSPLASVQPPVSANSPVVAIVGGTGFIGKYIARLLARNGYRLKIIARNANDAASLKTVGDLGQVVLLPGNIGRIETVARHLPGCHAVVNLVGILQEGGQRFAAIHAQGAEKLAQAARQAGVPQFIHFSALGVDRAPESRYARSKLHGENAVRAAFPGAVIFRPGVVFGPEDMFYNRFAALSALMPVLPVVGGETKFQPVYVGDVAEAALAALRAPEKANGRIFELTGPETYTLKAIMAYASAFTQRERKLVPLSSGLAKLWANGARFLPYPFRLTPDQVTLLGYDNVAGGELPGLAELGISSSAPELIVPGYLRRFRRASQPLPAM